ncbi:MAG TPA: sigma 54-interacting transcriptional regulator [Atribacterota bacterium]|nr:sigma 54-interacting transcriptional regulator [Atribacterota bacterium]
MICKAYKKLVVIAIQEEYLTIISNQIKEIFGDVLSIRAITVKDIAMKSIHTDELVLLSGEFILQIVKSFLPDRAHFVIAKRSLNFVNMKELLKLPKGKHILVVNDTKINTEETIRELKESVFEHYYHPYYPDMPIEDNIDYVVTPGEKYLIPKGIKNIIDIGPRVISLETIYELFDIFDLEQDRSLIVGRYIKSLAYLSKRQSNSQKKAFTLLSLKNIKEKDNAKCHFTDIITYSRAMKDTVEFAKKIAITDKPVHIFGDTGTGKTMMAQAIHNASQYCNGPYIDINCAARTKNTLKKELFGLENDEKVCPSLFEIAEGGTLCIEEIGEMPLILQRRLIQAIEENNIIKTNEALPVKVRMITTSSNNLLGLVEQGRFRKDLFYLLSSYICKLPSLSERKEDFKALINTYLKKHLNRSKLIISDDVMEILKQHCWLGNVRELFNVISYLACIDEKIIRPNSLPFFIKATKEGGKIDMREISKEIDEDKLISEIERHGFLEESIAILEIFSEGKKRYTSYGRIALRKLLEEEKGIKLSNQQLRLRLEVLNNLNLLIVRRGRSGTTISREGEKLFYKLNNR